MYNPEKLVTQDTQDKKKQKKKTTQNNMCLTPLYVTKHT